MKTFLARIGFMLGCLTAVAVFRESKFLRGGMKDAVEEPPGSSRSSGEALGEEVIQTTLGPKMGLNSSSSEHLQAQLESKVPIPRKEAIETRSEKPTFVMLVGPGKTGSTFLQSTLCRNRNNTVPILDQDNLMYIGTCPHRPCGGNVHVPSFICHNEASVFNISRAKSHHRLSRLDSDMIWFTRHAMESKSNAMIVYEGLHGAPPEIMEALVALLLPDWNVQILIAYRPLHQWLISLFNQKMKPRYFNPKFGLWPNTRKGNIVGVEIHPPFAVVTEAMDYKKRRGHPVAIAAERFSEYFGPFRISIIDQMNFQTSPHATGNASLQHLFCATLTPHTSIAAQSGELERGKKAAENPSVPLDYDRIATAAYKRGLILHTVKRKAASRAIRKHHIVKLGGSPNDLLHKCLPEKDLEHLLEASFEAGKKVFGDAWTSTMEQQHRNDFASKHVAGRRFCYVTDRILNDESWRSFLISIGANKRRERQEKPPLVRWF